MGVDIFSLDMDFVFFWDVVINNGVLLQWGITDLMTVYTGRGNDATITLPISAKTFNRVVLCHSGGGSYYNVFMPTVVYPNDDVSTFKVSTWQITNNLNGQVRYAYLSMGV